jgi:hypothetical protein
MNITCRYTYYSLPLDVKYGDAMDHMVNDDLVDIMVVAEGINLYI